MSITTGTLPGVRIVDMPDLGAVTDNSSVVGEHAGSGRFAAAALRDYATAGAAFVSIAALRANAIARSGAATAQVGGYYAVNDGGGGTFVRDPADTTTADNAGTVIVDAIGQRWFRDTGGAPLSVRWFGAKGDTTTDDTAAIRATIATGQPVYIPPGYYLVKDAINCANPGQLIRGAGRAVSVILVNSTFNMAAQGVFVLTSGEPAAYLKSFKIRFAQPDTTNRASLTTYPAAIYAVSAPRCVIEEFEITNATIAVNLGGNSGGAYIKDLQASFYQYGVYLDGSVDTVRIYDLHCAGFEMTANQLLIAQSLGTTCVVSGRCDDLKLSGCLFLFYADLNLFAGTSGYTFGSAVNCAFDGFNGIAQAGGGRFSVSNSYFTISQANWYAVSITNGIMYIDNCWFGQANSGSAIVNVAGATGGNVGRLVMNNCSFETSSGDVTSVVVNAVAGGAAEAAIGNCYFNRTANIAYTQPTISVGNNVNSGLSMSNCRANNKGTGAGTFINIPTDNQHRIIGNNAPAWTNSFPTAVLGVYQYN